MLKIVVFRADAETQAEDRDGRESLAVPEAAKGVPGILEEHGGLDENGCGCKVAGWC